jgi:hypothetical protein
MVGCNNEIADAKIFVTLQPSEVDLGGWSGIGLFL